MCVAVMPGAGKKNRREADGARKARAEAPESAFDEEVNESAADGADEDLEVDLESDDEEDAERGGSHAVLEKGESAQMKLMRNRTLEKYTQVLRDIGAEGAGAAGAAGGGSATTLFDDKFAEREERRKLDKLKASDPDFRATRRKRAQTLKHTFFDNLKEGGLDLAALAAAEEKEAAASSASAQRGGAGNDDEDDSLSVQDPKDAFNYPLMEDALEASLKALEESKRALKESERVQLDQDKETVTLMARSLIAEQERGMRAAKAEAKKLTPRMNKHISRVSLELAKRLKEDLGQTAIVQRGASKREMSRAKSRGLFSRARAPRSESRRDLHRNLTEQGRAEQARYEAEVSALRKELGTLHRHLSLLRTEERFPRGMQWKLKVDAGDGTFIGVRDLEVGKILADFSVRTGEKESSRITLCVSNIEASVGILDLSIRGGNAKAKILGGLLTPTINRLDLDVKGEWTLELKYMPGDSRKQQARWVEVRENSRFNLDIKRKVTGLTTMRLPKTILQTLSKMLLPKLISGALRTVLPTQLGTLLSEEYNNVKVEGRVDVRGDMSPTVWREPLVGPTAAASRARAALGISEEEAVAVDFMCRGERALAAGFKRKAMSLARLFKWRLKYATYKIADLEPLLDLVQRDANVELPKGWFAQLVKYVTLLAKKPLDFKVQITHVRLDVDLGQAIGAGLDIYLSSFQAAVNMARAQKARAVALKALEEAETQIATVNGIINDYVVPIIHRSVRLGVSGMLVGGLDTGLVALSLTDVHAQAKLPARFLLRGILPASNAQHPLEVEGVAGPRDDEYTLRITERRGAKLGLAAAGAAPLDGADSEVSLRNTKLELFPTGAPAGTVRLEASEVRASLQLSTLDIMLQDINDSVQAKQLAQQKGAADADRKGSAQGPKTVSPLVAAAGFVFPETKEFIKESEAVVGMFRTFDQDEEDQDVLLPSSSRPAPIARQLPRLLAHDVYDMRVDVKGLEFQVDKVAKEGGREGEESLRLTAVPTGQAGGAAPRTCAVFHVRLNMRDMFDEFLY